MFLRRLYYIAKPFLPDRFRIALRRTYAQRIRQRSSQEWPIREDAGMPPNGWNGWPDQKRFAFVLSHDVEGQLGVERVKQVAELEMEFGFRSSFNFIPEGGYETPAELRQWLDERGFEVGVHDLHHDGKLYWSRETFAKKAARINRYLSEWKAVGFRSGFMLRNLEWIHDLEITYDASTFDTDPFEPQPDGAKTIFPFWIPAGESKGIGLQSARGGYVELPYTLAQDFSLFVILQEQGIDIWKQKCEWLVQRGGMVLLNTHPDYMRFSGKPALREFRADLYASFLGYVQKTFANQYWHALPRDVASWAQLGHRKG